MGRGSKSFRYSLSKKPVEAYLLKWCQKCPLAGYSYVSAYEEGCMYHSSSHSLTDLWAACKSKRRSGWVLGAVKGKYKIMFVNCSLIHYFVFLLHCARSFPRNSNLSFVMPHPWCPSKLFCCFQCRQLMSMYTQIGSFN